ncbi:hypothetical protein [Micromonospora sp. 4G55]|uniref:hypothetical protein n=1 Tax=Micromonospora sp. 4G55 TaxID=2806102 RepID=UPI001A3CF8EF|nr:hypothetical protein [Micromonospora sp. 4G55]MBM0255512.1 hypothetical protein [Micromonospora sp. 4G55]
MTRTLHLAAALLLATATLAGCSDDAEPAAAPTTSNTSAAPSSAAHVPTTASPTPSAPRPPADGGSYDSPLVLVEALGKGGITCTGYSAIAQPRGALARGNCYVGGEEYTVGIYKSPAQARQQPNTMAELLEGVSDVNLVLGRNWTVGCPDQPSCQQVAAVLGGEVFHEPA